MESEKNKLSGKDSEMLRNYEVFSDAEKDSNPEKKDTAESKKARKKRLAKEAKEAKQPWAAGTEVAEKPKEADKSQDFGALFEVKEPAAEFKGDPEKLDDHERNLVVEQGAAELSEQSAAELQQAPEDSPEELAALASAVFAETLKKRAQAGEVPGAETIQQVATETIAVLDLPPSEADELIPEEQSEVPPEAEDVLAAPEISPDTDDREDDQDDAPTTASAPAGTPPPPPPAAPFVAPAPNGPNMPSTPMAFHAPAAPLPSPNAMPAAATGNVAPKTVEISRSSRERAADLWVGGFIGYMIGRRRTKNQLLPVQKKLEHEVKGLRKELKAQDERVRAAAAKKTEISPAALPQVIAHAEAINAMAPAKKTGLEKLDAPRDSEQPTLTEKEPATMQRPAEKILGSTIIKQVEQAPRISAVETAKAAPRVEAATVATMATVELLQVAKNVRIDGISAERMYHQNQLDQEGLKKVVTEYVRGGNPERVLATELHSLEIKRSGSPEFAQRQGGAGSAAGQSVQGGGAFAPTPNDPVSRQATTTSSHPEVLPLDQTIPKPSKSQAAKVAAGTVLLVVGVVAALALLA